jgi:hypothetical protein
MPVSMHNTERAIFQFQLQNLWWVAESIEFELIKNINLLLLGLNNPHQMLSEPSSLPIGV